MRRGCQRRGSEDALPAEIAEMTTMPDTGSKRNPQIALSGCGFSQAHSQLTHGPPSATSTRCWLCPQSGINGSREASTG